MDIEADAPSAEQADAYDAAEKVRAWSALVGAELAALAGALVLAASTSIAALDATPLERLGTALATFALAGVLPLPLLLLVQLVVDERMRRRAIPFGLVALARGVTFAVLAGALLGLFGVISGQIAAAPSLMWAGAAAGLWVGSIGTVLGLALERSRGARIMSTAVVLAAIIVGFVALVMLAAAT
ncbi:hypothetical protein CLV49_1521 [Labedella gwakjiensis]|uniref:Uncharacterized protein n=1 Tax=Labedella gwakjiensis TaxID=390269 RepID=A0A2P8GVE5_9MICO|nr:hypothetical protein [Labedella gwakjiensis]PSL37913.1 hypothetical protein CLV49_1521 [Labedella gwakjiensis]RUQ87519.1 hypothetical protein ELQ93_11590 [Labedella gwakjiensis]